MTIIFTISFILFNKCFIINFFKGVRGVMNEIRERMREWEKCVRMKEYLSECEVVTMKNNHEKENYNEKIWFVNVLIQFFSSYIFL